jgi:photosystem II stability/assembly factor-like uncharacterized protein
MQCPFRGWISFEVIMSTRFRLLWAFLCVATLATTASAQDVTLDSDTLSGLPIRSIGPAAMGGRIADIAAVRTGERLTIYIGSASGGVWKSVDSGITFKAIFDKQPSMSIGSIAIDPTNPQTVWVGTGESWARNSVSVGTGMYRSRDGGDNWESVGLPDSEHIASIAIHPKDGNTVFACALGHLWNSNTERGVFKTTDGGKTWNKVLYRNDSTGCANLAMDPQDPNILYAGMWDVRREPHNFRSGGPGSGLFKSTDGGATWKELRKGLPEGDLGRIGIAVAPSNHARVYAVVEARNHTALFRSDDAGDSWTEVNSSFNISGRPFYFARLSVDPKNADRVYKPGFFLTVSDDAGKSFSAAFSMHEGPGGGFHGDVHALWINPDNPDQMLMGTDGGVYQSLDQATHWRFLNNLPVSQFYHVSFDMAQPYNVYGGLQDNGTWMGPSRAVDGIANRHWRVIDVGDGFWAFSDPADPDYAYAEYQGGRISRFRKSTGELRDIKPLPRAGEPDFRFNWNSPIHMSPNHPGTIYLGAQFLFRSRDHGESWDRISPDLTTNDPARQHQELSGGLTIDNSDAEKFETIYTIAESPKNGEVIWVGTDDGNVQLTRDGGKHWTNLTKNVGLPVSTWVSTIEASHFDPSVAYVTFDGHAAGDMQPHVYQTKDYGKTWTSISTPEITGYAHVVRQDLVNANLLFVGTEFGLFISIDGGAHWAQFKGSLPNVAVRDIAIHPRESDLILATHGRGIYILDDLTSLRALTPELLAKDLVMLPSRPSELTLPAGEQRFDGDAEFVGRTLPETASIAYYQRKRHIFGDLKVDVYDDKGNLLTSLQGDKRRGLNRLQWPERGKPPKVPAAAGLVQNEFLFYGPQVQEGTYNVKLTKGKETYTSEVKLVPDPRTKSTAADRALQHKTVVELYDMLSQLTFIVDATNDLHDQTKQRASTASDKNLKQQLDALVQKLEEFRSTLVSVKEGGMITGELKLREHLGELYGAINGYSGRPTQSQIESATVEKKQLDDAGAKFQSITTSSLPLLNTALQGQKLEPLKAMSREDWDKKQK